MLHLKMSKSLVTKAFTATALLAAVNTTFASSLKSVSPNPSTAKYYSDAGELVIANISRSAEGAPAPDNETGYSQALSRPLNEFYYLDAEKELQKGAAELLNAQQGETVERLKFGAFIANRTTDPILSRSILATEVSVQESGRKAIVYSLVGSSTHLYTYYMQVTAEQILNQLNTDSDLKVAQVEVATEADEVAGLDAVQIFQKYAAQEIARVRTVTGLSILAPPTYMPIYEGVNEYNLVSGNSKREHFLVSQRISNATHSKSRSISALITNDGKTVTVQLVNGNMLFEKLYTENCATRGNKAIKYVNSIGATSSCIAGRPY